MSVSFPLGAAAAAPPGAGAAPAAPPGAAAAGFGGSAARAKIGLWIANLHKKLFYIYLESQAEMKLISNKNLFFPLY
jgi:hypothetical protein